MWGAIKRTTASLIARRKLSYQYCFHDDKGNLTIAGQLVMKDLAGYCNAFRTSVQINQTSGGVDPYAMAFEEGKRAVLNRIKYYLSLDDTEIYKLYKDLEE